jgi:hypothetical protein
MGSSESPDETPRARDSHWSSTSDGGLFLDRLPQCGRGAGRPMAVARWVRIGTFALLNLLLVVLGVVS